MELRKLYGFFNYFKRFIRSYSIITTCFRQLLTKDSVLNWTEEHDRALENLKKALLTEVVLIYPDFDESFTIITNASSKPSVHMLCQMEDNVLRPVALGKRAYSATDSKLCSTDLELLSTLNALDTSDNIYPMANVLQS
jgi:hypothetical protein